MQLAAITLALLLAAGAVPNSAADALGAQELPDQRGGTDSLGAHRGQPVVVVIVDARRMALVRRWEQQLLTCYPDLKVLTIADVNEARRPDLERVQAVLARRVPAGVAVLIDLKRAWAMALGLDTAAPNLLLFDAQGRLVDRFRGRWNEVQGNAVLAAVASLKGPS